MPLTFEIRDNVKAFKRNDWKFIAGVFIPHDGNFEGWPKGENTASILLKSNILI